MISLGNSYESSLQRRNNFAVSFKQDGLISKLPFFMVLPILGLDPLMIAVAGVISTLQVVGHTQIIN